MEGTGIMKIGDLVKLSAYGKQRKRAGWIEKDDIGLIVKLIKYDRGHWPDDYQVRWTRSDWLNTRRRWTHERNNTRRDLAYVK